MHVGIVPSRVPATAHEIIKGVFTSAVFSHLITNRSLLRQYCLIEARTAMLLGKPCLVWREDDERQAGYI